MLLLEGDAACSYGKTTKLCSRIVPNPYFKEKTEHKHSVLPYNRRVEAYRPQHGKQTGKTPDSVEALEGNK